MRASGSEDHACAQNPNAPAHRAPYVGSARASNEGTVFVCVCVWACGLGTRAWQVGMWQSTREDNDREQTASRMQKNKGAQHRRPVARQQHEYQRHHERSTTALHEEHHPDESITRRALSHRKNIIGTALQDENITGTARRDHPHGKSITHSKSTTSDKSINRTSRRRPHHAARGEQLLPHHPTRAPTGENCLDENHRASDENITGTARREHQQHRRIRWSAWIR